MKRIFVFLSMIFVCLGPVFGNGELSKINAQIKQTEQQNKKLEQQVKTSDRDIAKTKKQLVKTADKVSSLEDKRAEIQKKIAELDAQHDAILRDMQKNKQSVTDAASGILFVASHPSFNTEDMRDYVLMSATLSGVAESLDEEIDKADKQIKQLESVLQERNTEMEKLEKTAKKYNREKIELDKLLRARSAQNEKLKNEQLILQKKLRELSARAKSISELSAGVGSSEMSEDERFSRKKLNLPVRGRIVVKFGEKTALGLMSDGWRIRTRGDALVMAPADGVIKFADSFRGFGRVVIMSHKNGYNTVMTNLGDINVALGQDVLAGEPIGRMNPDKPEMYLEVRRGNNAVNPGKLFKEN
ncbi:MAG: peptidoglycan DD-metalloendopeptidase family protein [Alphaproteobacteria bacterium]|nr:peptidoglycan DD-metalloendopeptidase family protein [Alphaproteobacteria bacterium]